MDSYRNGASHRHGSSHASHRAPVEEQPGLEVYHPPAGDNAANAPEVYFSEDINPSQYTFYREGTPTPPEDGREKRFSGAWAVPPPSVPDSSAAYPQSDDPHVKSARVCGIQRRLLWVVIPVIFFLVLAIAIGIGVGVGVGRHVSGGHPAASTSTTETPSSASVTSTVSTTIASGTQSSSAPIATSTSAANCPSGNNTVYSVPGSDKKFLQLCGVDYSGKEEAVDLANVLTANMQECMDNCAGFTGCTACGWGVIDGDKGDDHRCWLKNDLGKSHKATSNWAFAILQ